MTNLYEQFFLRLNKALSIIYPDGLDNTLQHRDVCRIFYVGYIESVLFVEPQALQNSSAIMDLGEKMAAEDWQPTDPKFNWWEHND